MSEFDQYYGDLLKDTGEAMPAIGIRIIAFYDSEGDLRYRMGQEVATNNVPISQVIGIMEMARAELLFDAIMLGRTLMDQEDNDMIEDQ